MLTVSDKTVVSLDYTLRLDDGSVTDTSEGGEPLEFVQGQGTIIPGLEKALYAMSLGEEKDVVVAPTEGYGEFNSEMLETLPRNMFPPDMELEEGMGLRMRTPSGEPIIVYVDEITDDEVVVDLNHPLAGQTLHFHVKIAGLREATDEEVANGLQGGGCGCGCSSCGGECSEEECEGCDEECECECEDEGREGAQ